MCQALATQRKRLRTASRHGEQQAKSTKTATVTTRATIGILDRLAYCHADAQVPVALAAFFRRPVAPGFAAAAFGVCFDGVAAGGAAALTVR
jgi:hypothetical protein